MFVQQSRHHSLFINTISSEMERGDLEAVEEERLDSQLLDRFLQMTRVRSCDFFAGSTFMR